MNFLNYNEYYGCEEIKLFYKKYVTYLIKCGLVNENEIMIPHWFWEKILKNKGWMMNHLTKDPHLNNNICDSSVLSNRWI